MLSLLAQIDPKTAEVAVVHVEKQPWVAVVVCLAAICLTMVVGLVWIMRSVGPWIERREKSAQDHISGLLAARGKESERDLQQVTEKIGLNLENKIERIGDSVANVRQDLARIAAKIGVAGVILLLLTGSITSAQVQREAPVRVGLTRTGELARVGTGEPGVTPAPGKLPPPGPVRKDCDSTTCKPPGRCERGQCVGSARKPAPTKLAGQAMGASSYAVRAAWQDTEPEAFPERLSDAQWLAQQL